MELDLASLASVRSSAEQFNKLNLPLHYLILNAGVMACPYGKTKDGFETQFGTKVLGHFLLANLLLPSLIRGAPARVVSVSSNGHIMSPILWDDVNFEKTTYDPFIAYGQSKTGNILFANEFNRRYKDKGVIASSLHPGFIMTDLGRHLDMSKIGEIMGKLPNIQDFAKYGGGMTPKSVAQGAATTLYVALSPETAQGGKFYFDSHEADAYPHATDPENGKRLWELASKLVGL